MIRCHTYRDKPAHIDMLRQAADRARGAWRSGLSAMVIEEGSVPVREEVRGACEILGLDPLYVANEGRFVCVVPAAETEDALTVMRSQALGVESGWVGEVSADPPGLVTLQSRIGVSRIVDMSSGEQLPQIC